jgi:hypothetical protein
LLERCAEGVGADVAFVIAKTARRHERVEADSQRSVANESFDDVAMPVGSMRLPSPRPLSAVHPAVEADPA